jgi:hypothetical protein
MKVNRECLPIDKCTADARGGGFTHGDDWEALNFDILTYREMDGSKSSVTVWGAFTEIRANMEEREDRRRASASSILLFALFGKLGKFLLVEKIWFWRWDS